LFSNNIWTSRAPVRIAAFGTIFWLLSELARSDRLWTFSSHSMPWKMLLDVGFWQKDIVSEDSRIFLQAFLHYHGDYRVVPMFLPVSMDTVAGVTYWDSLKALYKQQRRWAWGVEHFPVMVAAFKKDKLLPLNKKIKYLWNHLEGMYTWATAPVLIFALGYLPLWVAAGSGSAIIHAAPFTLEWIMRLAMGGAFITTLLSLTMLPPRPKSVKSTVWIVMVVQWLLLPITFTLFGALPAIDAQTRLMFGKYLGFNVTRKSRG
jgi:cellulose synthase/poly-beta-1,6-N-acetylglucosamine synthase-like glycosyltransferase